MLIVWVALLPLNGRRGLPQRGIFFIQEASEPTLDARLSTLHSLNSTLMCARVTLRSPNEELIASFGLVQSAPPAPSFNVAPTRPVAVVRERPEGRVLDTLRWGLVPHWARSPQGTPLINARIETVAEKPAFRDAFHLRRGLLIADGFYEWERVGRGRQPFLFTPAGGGPFAFAGIWARWSSIYGETLESCALITRPAQGVIANIHDRMPAILPKDALSAWLDLSLSDSKRIFEILEAATLAGAFNATPVSPRVNDVRNDDLACIKPLKPVKQGILF